MPRRSRSGKKKSKKFRELADRVKPADVYELSDLVNEKLGAAPFEDKDKLKAYEALLRFAQSEPYAYWCVIKMLRDISKSALEWQDMLIPGQLNQEAFVQEAFMQNGIWKGTTQVAKCLSVEYLSAQRAKILTNMQLGKVPQNDRVLV